ncbi:hypothetical protein [uncultured Methanomethylovorans sp.]|uniref:hypothetical protein n=1 Tax=uncultured Methanomethylovorans sp. TaxID=183759 RepID=UPI002AA816C3|nr:hypothetical protein [uncultured Methanomethylovorans sp.]
MSRMNMESKELLGYIVGYGVFLIWSFSVFMSVEKTTPISDWIMYVPIAFSLASCHYLLSKNVIDANKKIDDKISIMSNVIGMILWSAVIVILSPHYTLIEDSNMNGGYLLILLIYYISRSQLAEAQRSKELTFNFLIPMIVIFNHVASLLIPYIFPK